MRHHRRIKSNLTTLASFDNKNRQLALLSDLFWARLTPREKKRLDLIYSIMTEEIQRENWEAWGQTGYVEYIMARVYERSVSWWGRIWGDQRLEWQISDLMAAVMKDVTDNYKKPLDELQHWRLKSAKFDQ